MVAYPLIILHLSSDFVFSKGLCSNSNISLVGVWCGCSSGLAGFVKGLGKESGISCHHYTISLSILGLGRVCAETVTYVWKGFDVGLVAV